MLDIKSIVDPAVIKSLENYKVYTGTKSDILQSISQALNAVEEQKEISLIVFVFNKE